MNSTWNLRIELTEAGDAVHDQAVLVDGPTLLTRYGRAAVRAPGSSQSRAIAARRSLSDLTQSMRAVLESQRLVVHLDRA
jgi:hypothetical protein